MEYAKTVGELKKILEALPEGMPLCRFIRISEKHGEFYGSAALEMQVCEMRHIGNHNINFLVKSNTEQQTETLSDTDTQTKNFLVIENKTY